MLSNLRTRWNILRVALGRRYVWKDLAAMVQAHGVVQRDIRANVHPLQFVAGFNDGETRQGPNYDAEVGAAEGFREAGAHAWNSEASVSRFLGDLAVAAASQNVVELGCFVGWTSAHLAAALRWAGTGGRLWCVDFSERFLEAARANLAARGLDSGVEFVRGMSLDSDVLAALPSEIDLLFVDTSHEYEDTLRELTAYRSRVRAGGFVALHDSISQPGVRRALQEHCEACEMLTFATEWGNGLTVLRWPSEERPEGIPLRQNAR